MTHDVRQCSAAREDVDTWLGLLLSFADSGLPSMGAYSPTILQGGPVHLSHNRFPTHWLFIYPIPFVYTFTADGRLNVCFRRVQFSCVSIQVEADDRLETFSRNRVHSLLGEWPALTG